LITRRARGPMEEIHMLDKTTMARWLAAAATTAAVLAGAPAHAQGKGETVRFQDYPGTGNMLIRVAISKGYCEKYGLKCTLSTIPTGPLGAQALLAKSIDGGLFAGVVMAPAIAKGAKFKMVTGGATSNVSIAIAGNHVDAPNAGKPFPAFMQDMKGKKVGTPARGSGLEVVGSWMLEKAGMKADDVTWVAVGGPNTAYGALTSKQVDFLFMFDPAGSMCDVLKTCKTLWRAGTDKEPAEMFALNGGGNGLVFRQDYIDQNPHVIEAVIKAVKDADAFLNAPANFKEVLAITQQYFKFDFPKGDEVLERVMRIAIDTKTYVAAIDRKAVAAEVKLFADLKLIERAPDISELVDSRAP
jgi:NitT/TauT family transport system substrate-binding protein